MVASALLAMAISTSGGYRLPTVVPPTPGAVCDGSPRSLTLSLDNMPDDNRVSTSIVNIWAFVPEKQGAAKAWLFLDGIGDYYFLFSGNELEKSYSYLPESWRYFKGKKPFYEPVELTPEEILDLEARFGAHNIIRVSCFTHDYKI